METGKFSLITAASVHKIPLSTASALWIFPHPPKSPDVSPIEPFWYLLKRNIRNRSQQPRNVEELKQAAREAWEAITEQEIDRQMHMEARINALLANGGGHTKY